MPKLAPGFAALRAHDLHQGLQGAGVDRSSGLVGQEMEATQLVGMAGALATAIKGIDVVGGADLKLVADNQLDIPTFAFDSVIRLLEEVSYVRNVRRDAAGRVAELYETVPEDFRRLYSTLDEAYESRQPGEVELAVVGIVDQLSRGPKPLGELGLPDDLQQRVTKLGEAAEAIRIVRVAEEDVAVSPYFAYEHPEVLADVLSSLRLEEIQATFEKVRGHQGLPVSPQDKTMNALIAAGLMAGPAVASPRGEMQSFAIAPYGLPTDLLTIRKPVLDKALAVAAAVRMGETEGGFTNLRNPVTFLGALLQPDRVVGRHSSTRRQYSVLHQMGIVRFQLLGDRWGMQLVDSADNREAIRVAIDLLRFGEAMETKVAPLGGADLHVPGTYRAPIQSVRPARKRTAGQLQKTIADLIENAMGRRPIE